MTRSTLLRLGRELRYRAVPELLGRTIEPSSLDAVVPALSTLVEPWLGAAPRWITNDHLARALAKYGLIDTSFAAPSSLLDGAEAGIQVLRANGFVPAKRQSRHDDASGGLFDDETCLDELVHCLDENICCLKLFLRSAAARQPPRLSLPADYFPRQLVVEDACVTNAALIWFHKHSYL